VSGAFRIRASRAEDVPKLLEIWRRSVDATHDFLSGEDRKTIDRIVAEDYLPSAELMVAVDASDAPVAFLGGSGREIESLFVDPAVHGRGVGRLLIRHFAALGDGELRVEVNEQNARARAFYERLGFRIEGRSPNDGDGRPYPLLHLVR
jgi:putative acetyltransferase